MPGIFTHNYIFRKAADSVYKRRGRSYLFKSIDLLLSSPEYLKAGLFGAVGPNIFDYMQPFKKSDSYGSEISFNLHDRSYISFVQKMIDVIMEPGDYRNEWSSAQRAYLLGYVSHIISDSVIHPYVFYSSGFPGGESRHNQRYYRKENLRFQYNIDNWFLYRDEEALLRNADIREMVPSPRLEGERGVWSSLRSLILESLRRSEPEIFARYFGSLEDVKIDGSIARVQVFDKIPGNIMLCYRLKRSEKERTRRLLDRFNESSFTYSDMFIRYPLPKRIDDDALNIHQGRWQYPANQRGFRYESVLHLVKEAIERTVAAWEIIEGMIYSGRKPLPAELNLFNAYTGEKEALYRDMKVKDPVKLKV